MTVYVLGIGSNLNAEHQCHRMISSIRQTFGKVRVSALVTTTAEGIAAPDYMNAVVCFEADIDIAALLQWCKMVESQLGRDREQCLCAADIDLLLAFDSTEGLSTEKIISEVKEPWFRPLVIGLLNCDP